MDEHFDVDVVTRDDGLTAYGADLDFDVDDAERLCADVDLDEAGVDRLVELSEARDESDGACGVERIGAGGGRRRNDCTHLGGPRGTGSGTGSMGWLRGSRYSSRRPEASNRIRHG